MTIRSQIAKGYVCVLGLAMAGTMTGLLLGGHLKKQALAAQAVSIAEHKLLNELQVKILYNRPTKQLSPYLSSPLSLQTASNLMLGRLAEIEALLETRKKIYASKRSLGINKNDPREQRLQQLLDDYEADLLAFQTRLQKFAQDLDTSEAVVSDTTEAQKILILFVQSPEFADFVQLPKDLVPFVEYVGAQEQDASAALARVIALQSQVTFGSLILSVAIASLLAHYTSCAIAKPVHNVTEIAHRIIQERNFSLQVPVLGKGEVASLADSFNQLIAQVQQLLSQVEQKNEDLEAALQRVNQQQIQLVQAEKMSGLGQLVAGIAHEINNPVGFIHGNLKHVRQHVQSLLSLIQSYQADYPNPTAELQDEIDDIDLDFVQDDLPKILTSMATGTQRIQQIVLSLRNFSRMDEATFKPVNIHEGIESTLLMLRHRLSGSAPGPKITVKKDYDNLPCLTCSAGELNQAFMNILLNAIEALQLSAPEQTQYHRQAQAPQITIRTTQVFTDWVEIEIADNGPGMSEAVKNQVFEPFFTTKPVGQGTGMGLSLCYQIVVDTHRGKLMCFSQPAQGTSITIQLPTNLSTPITVNA